MGMLQPLFLLMTLRGDMRMHFHSAPVVSRPVSLFHFPQEALLAVI